MRFHWTLLVGLGVVLATGCRKPPPPQADLLARWHFVGTTGLGTDTNGATLKAVLALPETKALWQQTLGKLARAPFERLRLNQPALTNDCATLLRPLLADLAQAESYLELRGVSNRPTEWTLAVRLTPAKAELWRTNLANALASWTGTATTSTSVEGFTGWRLVQQPSRDGFGLLHAGDWILFGTGEKALPLQTQLAQRIRAQGRPVAAAKGYWLQAFVDWPRWGTLPPLVTALRLPSMELTLVGEAARLRTKVEMVCPQPLDWKPEAWLLPTNTIREPLISFTVAQGFGPRLKPVLAALGVSLETVPNQACLWALDQIPFQTFLATPVPDATNALTRLREQLPALVNSNLQSRGLGAWRAPTNSDAIIWEGLPFVSGFLCPAHEETNGGFVVAGLFPNAPKKVPPPPELLAQVVGQTNLAYYDWEITAQRLLEWRGLISLYLLVTDKPQLDLEGPGSKWLGAVAPLLGNSGTSVTVTGTNRLTLTRTAPVGLTGFEIVCLAHWLESTTFPWGYELPPPPRPKRKAAQPPPTPSPTNHVETGRQH